jgi:hypothetical protein
MEAYKIKVLVKSFPSYAPILAWYNANKPSDWQAIREAGRYEGGFEVPLTSAELEKLRQKYGSLDPNQYVRQLEWCRGELRQHNHYASLHEAEKKLLGEALQVVFGAEKVEITKIQLAA